MPTPYMSLILPTVGSTAGQTYADEVNAAFDLVDAHDHTSGKGTQIPTAGLLINADLGFGGYDAKALRMTRFTSQGSALSASLVDGVYVLGGELHFIDGSGNDVALTASGSVAGTTGSIGGLASPAACTYSAVTKTFTFVQDSSYPAKISVGDILLYETTSSPSNAVTIKSPSSLASAYSLTLPSGVPSNPGIVQMSTGGVLSVLAAPASNTSLLQSTTGGALSYVTTLPTGLTIPTATLSSPTITGATLAVTTMTVTSWPSFRAFRVTSNQTVSTTSATEIVFNTDSTTDCYDTNSNFDTSTGRFTPTAAGKYRVTASISLNNTTAGEAFLLFIRKNGGTTNDASAYFADVPGLGTAKKCVLSADFNMNGTTDYISCWVSSSADTSYGVVADVSSFSGARAA